MRAAFLFDDPARRFYCLAVMLNWTLQSVRFLLRSGAGLALSCAAFAAAFALAQDSTPVKSIDDSFLSSEIIGHIQLVEAALFNENWNEADSLIEHSRQANIPAPFIHLFSAARLQAEMFAREDKSHIKQFKALLDSAQAGFEHELQTARDSAALYYFLGSCKAHRALWESKFGSVFKAVKQGVNAKNDYQRGLEIDSSVYDLHTGLGAYRYWKSAKSGILRWTGIISDERSAGLDEVRLAIKRAKISPDGARSALIWMLINEKEYWEAAELAIQLRKRYSSGITFLWPLAECYQKLNKYSLALKTYLQIRTRLLLQPGNQINLIKVDYEVLLLARILEDDSTVQLIAAGFDKYSSDTPRTTRRKLSGKYRALQRL